MANFDALNAKIDESNTAMAAAIGDLGDAVTGAADRVTADVQALKDRISALELDTDDQAQVDAATAKVEESFGGFVQQVRGAVDALNAVDPVKVEDVPTDPEPTNPADNPNEPVQP